MTDRRFFRAKRVNGKRANGHHVAGAPNSGAIDLSGRRERSKPAITELPDSLEGPTKKMIWADCASLNKESSAVNLVLFCRFFKQNGLGC
jgi:hypothetical protein